MQTTQILHYRLAGKLGSGIATVYQAVDTRLDRTVALKFLPRHETITDRAREGLRTEAQAAALLEHPNIATLHGLEEADDGQLFLVMDYYRGQTLEDRLTHGPLPLPATLDIIRHTAVGLGHAHRAGIIHRDIKPANLMLTDEGELKILDFGLAQIKNPEDVDDERPMIGTMAYMAPEQAQGRRVGPAADLWSLGVVLYETLTGVSPFEGEGQAAATLLRIFSYQPTPVTSLRPELPTQLDELLAKLLAKDSEQRYPSAEALIADLEALQATLIPTRKPSQEIPDRSLPRTNIPPLASPLIGRSDETKLVALQLEQPACRVLTLLGAGGTGKTHLSMAVAHQQLQLGHFSDGVFMVELDALGEPELFPSRIAEAVGVTLRGTADPLEQLIGYFAHHKVLLILDNFEQVIEASAIISELVQRCPHLKVLIATRERLRIEEEWVVPVQGLPIPETSTESLAVQISMFGALELFQERARRVQPDFTINYESLPQVIAICRLTMGLPLGIELAAAWVRSMTPAAIAREIARNRDFLASPNSNISDRHHSIRSIFAHSWQRLTDEEQETLLRLSVFVGGFSSEAAAQVANAHRGLLEDLSDKSLLTAGANGRYQQHPLLRQYAEEKLAETPASQRWAEEQHSHYYVAYLIAQGSQLRGPSQGPALAAIELELRNIRRAWNRAVAHASAHLLGQASEPFRLFHDQRGLILEGLEQFSRATEALRHAQGPAAAMLGRLLVDRAWLDLRAGHYPAARELAMSGLDLLRPHGESHAVGLGLNACGAAAVRAGQYAEALPLFQEALALAVSIGDPNLEALSLDNLASSEQMQGHAEEAERYYRRSLAVSRQAGDEAQVALNLNNLGSLVLTSQGPGAAAPLFAEGLQLARQLELKRTIPFLLANLGLVAFQLGKHDHARSRFLEALELVRQGGEALLEPGLLIQLGRTARAEGNPDEAEMRLIEAFAMGWQIHDVPLVLEACTRLLELYAEGENPDWAAEALALILTHPACQQRDRELAQTLAQNLELPSPPEIGQHDARLAALVHRLLENSGTAASYQQDGSKPPRPPAHHETAEDNPAIQAGASKRSSA